MRTAFTSSPTAVRFVRKPARRCLTVATCLLLAAAALPTSTRADSTGEVFPGAASGDFSNPTNALTCNSLVASGSNNGDAEIMSGYGLMLPPTAVITGIQVRVRANDGSLNNRKLRIALSSNSGGTFTAFLSTRNFRRNSGLTDYVVGGSTVLWGRTWTAADFGAGFRIRATAPKANGGSPVNLDCIPVTVFYTLPGAPNLNISKTDSPDPVQPGQNITYTISYSNTGASAATGVVISDTIPDNTTFVSASPAPASAPMVGSGGTVTWNIGNLAVGGSGVVTLVVKTGAGLGNGTLITNSSYSIDGDQNELTTGNPVITTVSGTIALSLSKTDSPDPVAPGATLTYVLTITNGGTGNSNNIVVDEAFDGNVSYTAGNWMSSCAGITESGDTDGQWNIPTLGGMGQSCTITITTTVGSPLSDGVLLFNSATVIDAANNTAEASAVTTVMNPVVCGDGVVGSGEACDLGSGVNGTSGACCTASCQFRAGGQTCRPAAGDCDTAESCTGSSPTCPADAKSSAQCRASAGICDVAESCDGVSNSCPTDQFVPGGTECRAAAGVCDLAESCSGVAAQCPSDAKSTSLCRGAAGACDLAETCDGVGNDCPADAKSTATCRAAGGVCDVAESCDGVSNACPADAKSTGLCRAAAGDCDLAESCDGSGNDCPADARSTATCRAAAGVCDVAESCDGVSVTCPADTKSTAVCRATAGDCDLAEVCDGAGDDCPADAKSSATCRAAGGVCDVAESCDGASNACPADAKSTAVCRPAGGVCDVAESCDGVGDDCPSDAKNTALCRAAAGVCDVAEVCDGLNDACPADLVLPNGSTCRASAGICDQSEACDGVGTDCPANAFATGTECRAAAGVCDVAESCTGDGPDCPADAFAPATTICRAASPGEVCDLVESCSGSGPACPSDAVRPSGSVCRAAAGVCDVAESCDGSGKTCPADSVQPSTVVCRASSPGEVCDAVETCDGSGVTCPADAVLPSGTTCRASAGVCDPAEACNGTSKLCPADAKSTASCRAAAGVCDVAESCDGVGNDCPANGFVADGTSCDDTAYCNGMQACSGGVCGGGTNPCAMGQSCDEASNSCFVGDCPAAPSSCRTAGKNKLLIKNKSDDSKDKLIWKWSKGAATTQAEFGDPTDDASYALCLYAGATPTVLEALHVPAAGGRWSVVGSKGYKYNDPTGASSGIAKVIVKGGVAGKSKALVKGKGASLPDIDSELPIATGDLPVIVQLRNNRNGICWEGTFASPKKNLATQFNAKTP